MTLAVWREGCLARPQETLPRMYDNNDIETEVPVLDGYTDPFPRPHPPPAPEVPPAFCDTLDLCRCCREHVTRCKRNPRPAQRRPQLLGLALRPATTRTTLQRVKSNADQTPKRNKMEGTGAGALGVPATAATTLSEDPWSHAAGDGMTAQDSGNLLQLGPEQQSYTDTPQTPQPTRMEQAGDVSDARPETPNTERVANILANGPIHVPAGDAKAQGDNADAAAMASSAMNQNDAQLSSQYRGDVENWSVLDDEVFDSQDAQGFAKLMFPDGDYIVTTHDVELGRNMEVAEHYKRKQKEQKRAQQREQRRERVPPAQKELAQRELEMYQQEPSQPSLAGDDGQQGDVSNSSHSLEGRPAAQATFSETGGALAFAQDSDDEADRRRGRKKRRSMQYSKSSTSTTSVVPANLHPPIMTAEYSQRELFTEDGEPYSRTLAVLPVHTQRPDDIFKLSKKHLLFSFNFQDECWELCILGNGAFVNETLINRGETVPLSHNDEIQISSVTITFKLPDSHRSSPGLSRGTFSQVGLEDVDDLSTGHGGVETSPIRRLSNAFEDAASSDGEPAEARKSGHKIKIKGVKKPLKEKKGAGSKQKTQADEKTALKIGVKKQQRRRSDDSPSPDPGKKAEKGKKPKEAAKQPPDSQVVESIEDAPAPTPFNPEPGSAFASIPADELPQKRKGPGRPPKNGFFSKRDTGLVKKKERDFEKAGLVPPAFYVMLEMVRNETKQKEMQAKLQNGTLPPGTEVPAAVETDLAAAAVKAPSASTPAENGEQTGGVPTETPRRPSSPRPKRIARSPSPMKPASAYTDEDMKKPSATYVHILDEILRDHPTGQADLQEIYDRIQKRYPYFKYKATTQGWQSSVRHNLLSAPRFKETGRSGKGKLWTIDFDVPLEREKKKKPTPPPRPMPMMNGQYTGYGQQPYGNGYGAPPNGQRPVNGGPGYYSPYGQHGQNPSGHNMQNRQGPPPPGQAQPHGGQSQQQADPFGGLVPEILALRNGYLASCANDTNMQAKSEWIGKCVMVFSNRFHGSGEAPELTVETPEEKKAYADLDTLFKKYEALKAKQQEEQQGTTGAPPVQASAPAPAHGHGGPEGVASHPGAPQQQQQQTVQTAVADGVAYQTANGGMDPTAPHAPGHGQSYPAPGGAFAGSNAPSSVHNVPVSSASQNVQATAAYSAPANAMPNAPPPQSGPSASGQSGPTGFPSANPPTPTPNPGGPSPARTFSVPAQPLPQSQISSAPPLPPAQPPPVQAETKTAGPSPSMEQLAASTGTGTKRAAEDDAAEEIGAKRAKIEE